MFEESGCWKYEMEFDEETEDPIEEVISIFIPFSVPEIHELSFRPVFKMLEYGILWIF